MKKSRSVRKNALRGSHRASRNSYRGKSVGGNNVLLSATSSALARRKQITSQITRRTFGLRWKFMK